MDKIKILPNNLINKIAAGEVLERPASAVKELIENSLDANARKIDVFIKSGGKKEIIVSDDGEGIREDELEISLQRHATSKLSYENLEKISTLGFRGEALPSIAAVSNMFVKSNANNDHSGMEINFLAGEKKYIKPVSQKKGTSVIIKNLFFSTPARLKFLKSDNYETLKIKSIVQNLALSNYLVEFNLYVDEKNILNSKVQMNLDKKKKFNNRVCQIMGNQFLENSVIFEQIRQNFKFSGCLGLPTFHYSNSKNQFIFVNGRVINDKSLNSIFKVAYRDFLPHDRFPQLILFIDCPVEEVDINVHPAKNEVRFRDSNELRYFILSSFKSVISAAGHRSSSVNTTRALKKFSSNQGLQSNLSLKDGERKKSDNENSSYEIQSSDCSNEEKIYPLGYAKSQLHNTYIVSQTEKGIVIVDQHAAHERIIYEKLKKDFYNKNIKSQILLIPEIIELEKTILENFKENFSLIEKYGLKIELFGTNSIIVRELPSILSGCDSKKLILDIIDELNELGDSNLVEKKINNICSTMACHGSIRAGREMQIDEMNDLLRKMEDTPFSGQCNHGRPTYIELNLDDIEKLFGRK